MESSQASRRSLSRSVSPHRVGSETPRIFTPPLRKLTPGTSHGFDVITFAKDVLDVDLYPWQQWLLIHALELTPDGSFRFRNVVVLVARQNGKSMLSQVLALWFMYRYHVNLVLGTAQDLDTAEEVWRGAVEFTEEIPELRELRSKVTLNNGQKSLELKTGERYKVKAANRRSARGMSGDLILLDELREHQSWDAWGAITKTTMARADAQVWALSNAGDATSVVLRYLRKMAHAALGDPDGVNSGDDPSLLLPPDEDADFNDYEVDGDDSLGIFEWSAPPSCAVSDRAAWAMANPALGHSITERTVASACKTDPEWVFRTEVLCQWSDGSLEGPFPPGSWESCLDDQSQVALDSPVVWAVDVSWDRSTAHIAVAGLRPDGLPHVEPVASRAGTDWVVDWFTDATHPDRATRPIALQTTGAPVSSLAADLETAGLTVVPWTGSDLGRACGSFYDAVRAGALRHRVNPILDVAAATASTRPFGDSWLWDRKKSATDISPLVAATGALWCLTNGIPPPPKRSKYEDAELVVV